MPLSLYVWVDGSICFLQQKIHIVQQWGGSEKIMKFFIEKHVFFSLTVQLVKV